MRRVENNGHISFDAEDELWLAEHNIKRVLETLNPSHPDTLQVIVGIVREYGSTIDKAWSAEYSERTRKDAQQMTGTTLSAVLAGMQVGVAAFLVTVGSYDDKTYHIVRGAKDAEDALSQVKSLYKERYSGEWPAWEMTSIEEITLDKGVTRL